MSLVTLIKVSLNFFERQIFNEIGLQVNPGDRIGLVGRNGSGKTTLLRIIKGEISPESGEVRIAKNHASGTCRRMSTKQCQVPCSNPFSNPSLAGQTLRTDSKI